MKELVRLLNQAAKAYYQEDREIMSNLDYDRLYDELVELEKQTGTVLANSPTVQVGYEAVNELPKEAHESPMLSLDKTKDVEVLREFIGNQKLPALLENGWTDHRPYLPEWRSGESRDARKRADRRGRDKQCKVLKIFL